MEKNKYFKSLDHYSRRDAKVALALFLQKNGWQIVGFHEDQSDMMTDYYNPASWGGVATLGDYTLVVDCRHAEAGHDIKKSHRVTKPCEHCLETGEEPGSEWTLTKARQDPKGYNAYKDKREGHGVTLFSDVVSPVHFTSSGAEKCTKCHGTGEQFVRNDEEVIGQYPAHLANPQNRGWHLEKNGMVISSGQSIARMYYGYWTGTTSEQKEAVQQACEEFLTELRIAMELETRSEANKKALNMKEEAGGVYDADDDNKPQLSVELVDYSEKSFAVFGDTKPLWPKLEQAGGKFNRYLTHPKTGQKTPGVIFGIKRRAHVEQLIQSL